MARRKKNLVEKSIIKNNLKKYRKLNNLTLAELSKKSSFNDSFLSKLERGLYTITKDTADILSKVLNCQVSDLYCIDNNNNFSIHDINGNNNNINYNQDTQDDNSKIQIKYYNTINNGINDFVTINSIDTFLNTLNIQNNENYYLFKVTNNDFIPTIEKGDFVFVDTNNKVIKNNSFYLFLEDNFFYLKKIDIKSDNSKKYIYGSVVFILKNTF
jgi:phage repressor protein C with HTH and peptisase S24 domain